MVCVLAVQHSKHGVQIIKASVPLSKMFGYVMQLSSLSSDHATSIMEYSITLRHQTILQGK